MTDQKKVYYPSENASSVQLFQLAEEYRKSSKYLLSRDGAKKPISHAPFRLVTIHAIELYLNALLLHTGKKTMEIRAMQHDLARRTEAVVTSGIKLRKRTAAHLIILTEKREYLISRYGPEELPTASQINRLTATLDEVAEKVGKCIGVVPVAVPSPQPLRRSDGQAERFTAHQTAPVRINGA